MKNLAEQLITLISSNNDNELLLYESRLLYDEDNGLLVLCKNDSWTEPQKKRMYQLCDNANKNSCAKTNLIKYIDYHNFHTLNYGEIKHSSWFYNFCFNIKAAPDMEHVDFYVNTAKEFFNVSYLGFCDWPCDVKTFFDKTVQEKLIFLLKSIANVVEDEDVKHHEIHEFIEIVTKVWKGINLIRHYISCPSLRGNLTSRESFWAERIDMYDNIILSLVNNIFFNKEILELLISYNPLCSDVSKYTEILFASYDKAKPVSPEFKKITDMYPDLFNKVYRE